MANINLLPWREEKRREQNRETLLLCVGFLIVVLFIIYLIKSYIGLQIENQMQRNAYMQQEINALNQVISEIETLKDKRDQLLARMDVIQNVQQNRSLIVHVFDDLATKLPEGVYYNTITKSKEKLKIDGIAQSNARVSILMRNLEDSEWFHKASLNVVESVDREGELMSEFDVEVFEERSENVN